MRTRLLIALVLSQLLAANGCAPRGDEIPSGQLRNAISQKGPEHLVAVLESYPSRESEAVKSSADFEFLLEVFRGSVESPPWLSPSLPDYERARALSASYLANDHANRHFRLSPVDLQSLLSYGREQIARSAASARRADGIRMVGALGSEPDIELIASIGSASSNVYEIQQAILSLALMCFPQAEPPMLGLLEVKRELLTADFRDLY